MATIAGKPVTLTPEAARARILAAAARQEARVSPTTPVCRHGFPPGEDGREGCTAA